jgi:galactose-3-O-sulfotransferase
MNNSRIAQNEEAGLSSSPSQETVIFLHIPKTAGTTLNRLIEWEYPVLQMYSIDPVLFIWSNKHLRKLSPSRLQSIRMFKGHMLFGLHEILPQPASYITVLRDPVDRVLSAFYFMRSYKLHPLYWKFRRENWTLEDFVNRSPRTDAHCKVIAGADYESPCTAEIYKQALANIDRHFSVVGLSERFEESLALMKLRYGWKFESYTSFNVTRVRPKKRDLPQSTLDLIREKNAFDVALYDFASKKFEEEVNNNASEVARITRELETARERNQDRSAAALFSLRSAGRKALSRAYSAI